MKQSGLTWIQTMFLMLTGLAITALIFMLTKPKTLDENNTTTAPTAAIAPAKKLQAPTKLQDEKPAPFTTGTLPSSNQENWGDTLKRYNKHFNTLDKTLFKDMEEQRPKLKPTVSRTRRQK